MAAVATVAAVAGIAAAGSAIVGAISGSADRARAQEALNKAAQQITSLKLPLNQARPLIIEELKRAGVYTPELEEAINQEQSKLAQLAEIDPSVREAQKGALEDIMLRGKVGMTPEERAAANKMRRKLLQDSESRQASIMQQFQERGQGGSGAQLAAQLSAGQQATNAASDAADDMSATASKRALEALTQGASIAGQVRGQDMDLAKTRAGAEDEMNRFNVNNQISRNTRNMANLNSAQQANLAEAQRLADSNVSMRNTEKLRQRAGEQTDFQNRFNKAQASANAYAGQASNLNNNAAQTGATIGAIGGAIGQGINSYANMSQTQDYLDWLKNYKSGGGSSGGGSPVGGGDTSFNA